MYLNMDVTKITGTNPDVTLEINTHKIQFSQKHMGVFYKTPYEVGVRNSYGTSCQSIFVSLSVSLSLSLSLSLTFLIRFSILIFIYIYIHIYIYIYIYIYMKLTKMG